jgi:CHAD domain-containing protein
VERAEAESLRQPPDRDEAIHEARLAIKRLRALWRLVRPQVGIPLASRENANLREAARKLGGVRDERVVADTLALLLRRTRGAHARAQADRLLALVRADARKARELREDGPDEALRVAGASAAVMAVLPWEGWDWASVSPGLSRTYRRCVRLMHGCAARRENAAFHEWRKRVKDLQYQLEFATFTWNDLKSVQRRVRELGQLLGEIHDLAVLRDRIQGLASRLEAPPAQLVRALDRQLSRDKDRALLRGLGLFHPAPRDWLKSIRPKSAD